MEIIVHKDPVTGILTYEYKEEPKELTLEEKEKEDKWFNDIMESSRIHNEFMHRLTTSFWSLNKITFKDTWKNVFTEYLRTIQIKNSEKTKKEIQHDFKSSFIRSFIDSIHRKENQKLLKEHIYQVHDIWSSQLNGDILILLTWQMDFKEQALLLLEKNSCDYNADIYEHIEKEFIKDFRQYDLPLNLSEKRKILDEEKITFLQIQKTYCTFKKLNDKLVPKNIKIKSGKI